jgi:hypothetical protein
MTSGFCRCGLAVALALVLVSGGAAHAGSIDAGAIVAPRANHAALVLADGDVLLVGGINNDSVPHYPQGAIERYDVATHQWTSAASSPFILDEVGAVRLAGGKVVVSGNYSQSLYQYDPVANSWITLGESYQTHAWASVYERVPGEVMIVGGARLGGLEDSYVPTFNTATRERGATPYRHFNAGTSVQLVDGRVFSTGGFTRDLYHDYIPATASEVYASATDTWTDLGEARFPDRLVLLADGRVMAIGGVAPLAISIFNPATGLWTAGAPMLAPQHLPAVTRLGDGRVMISGGYNTSDPLMTVVPDVQIYDPATDRWSWSVPLPQPRHGHSSTLLPDGSVLIAGGGTFFASYGNIAQTLRYTPEPFDDDGDLVANNRDNCPGVANPDQLDFDHDGKGDACDDDDDDDGVPDATDNCRLGANPDQHDIDGDGIGDVCEDDRDGDGMANIADNCPDVANPDQADLDHDGKGDACDDDIDGDTAANAADNCPRVANRDQTDLDGDGKGDACDDDVDGDTATNAADNCPRVANSDQMDLDGDGKGDACDDDLDGDGVANALDNCLRTANPDQADADRDGKGDACLPNQPGGGSGKGHDPGSGGCQATRTADGSWLMLLAVGLLAMCRARRSTGPSCARSGSRTHAARR